MSLVYLYKVSAATILAVSVAACSSGGNHTKLSPSTPPLLEQDAAEKAAAEKAAADKAAADKAAADKAAADKAAADKAAAEKAAADKAAAEKAAAAKAAAEKAAAEKAAAEKAAAEKAAAEKAAAEKAAAEKAAAEKAAAEKAAAEKAAAEKAAAEKAAAEKAAAEKAAAEKAAAEKAAAEKAAAEKAAAEKAAAEKAAAEKAAAEKAAADKAAAEKAAAEKAAADKAAAEKAAAEKAEADRVAAEKAALAQAAVIKTKALKDVFGVDSSQVAVGYMVQPFQKDSLDDKNQYSLREGYYYVYQRPYSIVIGTWLTTDIKDDVNQLVQSGPTYNVDIAGLATQEVAIPTGGKATYTGSGAHVSSYYDLIYNVDFTKRTGSGYFLKATEYGGRILLDEGTIAKINLKGNDVIGISSSAKALDGSLGKYALGFYGTEAQEIAGSLEMDQSKFLGDYKNVNGKNEVGFGGTRGEISKK